MVGRVIQPGVKGSEVRFGWLASDGASVGEFVSWPRSGSEIASTAVLVMGALRLAGNACAAETCLIS